MFTNMFWVNRSSSPLYTKPVRHSVKVCDVPFGAVIESLGEFENQFARVRYRAAKIFEGWMYYGDGEALRHELPAGVVDMGEMQTQSQQDAAQYVVYLDNVQYNLCGELAMCFIVQESLPHFLETWKATPTSFFERVFAGGKGRTTGVLDLLDMIRMYPCRTMTIRDALWNEYHHSVIMTPRQLSKLNGWFVVVGVNIGGRFGDLRPRGIPHWVVVTNVEPTGVNRALVTLYNPFTNNMEQYSWSEFTQSVGTPNGLCVQRLIKLS